MQAVALLLALIVLVGASLALYASRPEGQLGAEPSAPSPGPAHPDAGVSFSAPPAVAATLNNAVLHWTATSYSASPGARDPYSGKVITSDAWAQTDASGAVVRFHAIYTDPGGAFAQEVLQDTARTTRVFSPAYAAVFPAPPSAGTNLCQSGPGGLDPSTSAGLLPPFSDSGSLTQQGFRLSARSAPAPALRATVAPPDTTPTHLYPTAPTAQRYERGVALAAGGKETQTIDIQADGRIVLTEATVTDAEGQILSQSRQSYGAVQVFAPGDVPASTFALSTIASETCHA
jgi:hypothetical protein